MRVVQTLRNVTFGMHGPYVLVTDPPDPLRLSAWHYTQMQATKLSALRDVARAKLDGRPFEALVDRVNQISDQLVFADRDTRAAFYGTNGGENRRWDVVFVADSYCYLTTGVDDEGQRYEPYLVWGRIDGTVQCKGCEGTGAQVYRPDLGPQTCFTCRGKGRYAQELPETVRRVVAKHAAEKVAEMQAAALREEAACVVD